MRHLDGVEVTIERSSPQPVVRYSEYQGTSLPGPHALHKTTYQGYIQSHSNEEFSIKVTLHPNFQKLGAESIRVVVNIDGVSERYSTNRCTISGKGNDSIRE